MSEKKIKVLISASGTGGHLIPAQELGYKLQQMGCLVFFAASNLSSRMTFQKEKFSYLDICSSPLGKKTLFKAPFKIFKGFFQSLKLIIKYKPNVIVGFGSYHTFPVVLAGYVLRKQIVLFDSNIILGKVNRVFAKKAKVLTTQFERKNRLQNEVIVKRFPWAAEKKSNEITNFNLDKNVFTILIFGGSQGAQIINKNFIDCIQDLPNQYKIQIIHILGPGEDFNKVREMYNEKKIKSYVSCFEKNLKRFYELADLVISRAGACSISECIHFEKPSILIPFKGAKEDHQHKNALFMQNQIKASTIITENHLSKKSLLNEIISFLQNDKKKLCLFKENIQKFKILEKEKNKIGLWDLVYQIGKK